MYKMLVPIQRRVVYWRSSIKVTLKSLLLLASMKKLSIPDERFRNKSYFFIPGLLSPFTLFLEGAENSGCSHILSLK